MLSDREREVFRLRYGLGDDNRHTLQEAGGIFRVTRERIRQIEAFFWAGRGRQGTRGSLLDEISRGFA